VLHAPEAVLVDVVVVKVVEMDVVVTTRSVAMDIIPRKILARVWGWGKGMRGGHHICAPVVTADKTKGG
jgi:hypothetical protein